MLVFWGVFGKISGDIPRLHFYMRVHSSLLLTLLQNVSTTLNRSSELLNRCTSWLIPYK